MHKTYTVGSNKLLDVKEIITTNIEKRKKIV